MGKNLNLSCEIYFDTPLGYLVSLVCSIHLFPFSLQFSFSTLPLFKPLLLSLCFNLYFSPFSLYFCPFVSAPHGMCFRLSEMEERLKDKTRMVSVLQSRVEYLEEENSRVLDQLENVTQQKFLLDKVLKEVSARPKQYKFK